MFDKKIGVENKINKNTQTKTEPIVKNVLIINLDKQGDKEITEMSQFIKKKKEKKNYPTTLISYQGKLENISLPKNENITQLVIAAHSRFYTRNEPTKAGKIGPFSKNQDSRHIGEYQLSEVSQLIIKALRKYPKLKEIKFYSCESAASKDTYGDFFNKQPRKIRGVHGVEKTTKRLIEFHIGDRSFKKYQKLLEENHEDDVSNIQFIMNEVYKHFKNDNKKPHQELLFQGLNGLGWMTEDNQKMRTFKQEFLQDSKKQGIQEEEKFDEKYVEGKETVDKLVYIFKF